MQPHQAAPHPGTRGAFGHAAASGDLEVRVAAQQHQLHRLALLAAELLDRALRLALLHRRGQQRFGAGGLVLQRGGERVVELDHVLALAALRAQHVDGAVLHDAQQPGHRPRNLRIDDARVAGLSPRLIGLLDLMAQGRDNSQIAAVLGLSEKTVRNHITQLFDRLEVDNRAQAIVLARENGLGRSAA